MAAPGGAEMDPGGAQAEAADEARPNAVMIAARQAWNWLTSEPEHRDEIERKQARWRSAGSWSLMFIYSAMLWIYNGGHTSGSVSGMKNEFMDELMPSEDKQTERIEDHRVGVELDKVMTVDDVVKVISIAQRFCATEAGINEHFRWSYSCRMNKLKIKWKKLTLDQARDDNTVPNGVFCDREQLSKAVVMGDNPFIVPFGYLPEYLRATGQRLFDEAYAMAFEPTLFDYGERAQLSKKIERKNALKKRQEEQKKKAIEAAYNEQHQNAEALPVGAHIHLGVCDSANRCPKDFPYAFNPKDKMNMCCETPDAKKPGDWINKRYKSTREVKTSSERRKERSDTCLGLDAGKYVDPTPEQNSVMCTDNDGEEAEECDDFAGVEQRPLRLAKVLKMERVDETGWPDVSVPGTEALTTLDGFNYKTVGPPTDTCCVTVQYLDDATKPATAFCSPLYPEEDVEVECNKRTARGQQGFEGKPPWNGYEDQDNICATKVDFDGTDLLKEREEQNDVESAGICQFNEGVWYPGGTIRPNVKFCAVYATAYHRHGGRAVEPPLPVRFNKIVQTSFPQEVDLFFEDGKDQRLYSSRLIYADMPGNAVTPHLDDYPPFNPRLTVPQKSAASADPILVSAVNSGSDSEVLQKAEHEAEIISAGTIDGKAADLEVGMAVDWGGAATPELHEARRSTLEALVQVDEATPSATTRSERRSGRPGRFLQELLVKRRKKPPRVQPMDPLAAELDELGDDHDALLQMQVRELQASKHLKRMGAATGGPGKNAKATKKRGARVDVDDIEAVELQKDIEEAQQSEYDNFLERIANELPPECYTLDRYSVEHPKTTPKYSIRPTCRNHHWGLFTSCQPIKIEIEFTVIYLATQRKLGKPIEIGGAHYSNGDPVMVVPYDMWKGHPRQFLSFDMQFKLADTYNPSMAGRNPSKGIYNSDLDTRSGEFPGEKTGGQFLCGVLFILSFTTVFRDEFLGLLWFPIATMNLIRRRKEVNEVDEMVGLVLDIFDPREKLRGFMSLGLIILGMVNLLQILTGCVVSMTYFFTVPSIPKAAIWTHQTDHCDLNVWTLAGYTLHCLDNHEGAAKWYKKAAEFTNTAIINWSGMHIHEGAVFTLFVQCLFIFNTFTSTAWVGATVGRAASSLVWFLVVFLTVVFGFAFLIHVRFGPHFHQFSQLDDTFLSLALFSFGMPDVQLEGATDIFWTQSRQLLTMLLLYSVAVLTFALNILTTIVIDSYYEAKKAIWKSARDGNRDLVLRYFLPLFPNVKRDQAHIEPEEEQAEEGEVFADIAKIPIELERLTKLLVAAQAVKK